MFGGRRAIYTLLVADAVNTRSRCVASSPSMFPQSDPKEKSSFRACSTLRSISCGDSYRCRELPSPAASILTDAMHSVHSQGVAELRPRLTRIAKFRTGGLPKVSTEPTYGVGPVEGAERDPKTKGSIPDDSRADEMHMAVPKEITKAKAAIAQQEPPDFEGKKIMPEWEKPWEKHAGPQRASGDVVFEENPRKLQGTAQKQGATKGNESSGQKMEDQYGATQTEGKTGRS